MALLETALTHRSFSRKQKRDSAGYDNERLEYLGDAVLKLLMSEYLYEKYPTHNEGDLTKIRSQLVSDRFLALLGNALELGKYLRFSPGEYKSGGATRDSNLSDGVEALLGCLYLDQGLEVTRDFFEGMLTQYMDDFLKEALLTDYKSTLQEHLQYLKESLPQYTLNRSEGPDHSKIFYVDLTFQIGDKSYHFEGESNTKKAAEQLAAQSALIALDLSK